MGPVVGLQIRAMDGKEPAFMAELYARAPARGAQVKVAKPAAPDYRPSTQQATTTTKDQLRPAPPLATPQAVAMSAISSVSHHPPAPEADEKLFLQLRDARTRQSAPDGVSFPFRRGKRCDAERDGSGSAISSRGAERRAWTT